MLLLVRKKGYNCVEVKENIKILIIINPVNLLGGETYI
jgi:hypothetical protein